MKVGETENTVLVIVVIAALCAIVLASITGVFFVKDYAIHVQSSPSSPISSMTDPTSQNQTVTLISRDTVTVTSTQSNALVTTTVTVNSGATSGSQSHHK